MKLIFLDIDGVLNHQLWSEEIMKNTDKYLRTYKEDYRRWFCPQSVELLNTLTNDTGAKIVVSSSFRKGKTVEKIRSIFKENGITGEVLDKTPSLNFNPSTGYTNSVPRGCEIYAWLDMNAGILGDKPYDFNKYVIFDDDSDMLLWQRNNFFHVDGYCGLTPNLIYKATKFLNQ